jgi:outer membrane protein assembly factor BamD (BamD/ComL family)
MKLSPKQAKALIILVQKTQIAEFFEQLQNLEIETTEINLFRREFMSGNYRFDFYDRLQTYINSIADTKYAVIQPKYDVFFSFSSKNVTEAEEVVAFLRKCGVKVFFSNEDLNQHVGNSFIFKINEALKTASHFLLLCTPHAINSNYILYECETFLKIYIESRKKHRIFILKGENFTMNLLKTVHFENIQLSEKEDIVKILGKKIPKDDLFERIDDYQELFELFYTDQIITDRERKHLQKKQEDLDLTPIQATEIENIVKEQVRVEKEYLAKQEETLWQNAKQNDLIKSYKTYLEKYSNGKYTFEAKNRISQLEQIEKQRQQAEKERVEKEYLAEQEETLWQDAKKDDLIKSYKNYLNKYSNGKYAFEAKNRISQLEQIEQQKQQAEKERVEKEYLAKQEETLWQNAKQNDLIKSYKTYLEKYPNGKYAFDAKSRISQLEQIKQQKQQAEKERVEKEYLAKQEEILWQNAKQNDLIISYKTYLEKYPNGKYAFDAKSRISQLEQIEQQKQQAEKERVEKEYLAKQQESLWQNAKQNDLIKSYKTYLEKYPNGKYAFDAKSRISQLEQIEQQKQQAEKERVEKEYLAKQEEILWQNAKQNDLIKSYKTYLEKYPNGKYAFDAKSRISQLEQIEQQKAEKIIINCPNCLKAYRVPQSKHVKFTCTQCQTICESKNGKIMRFEKEYIVKEEAEHKGQVITQEEMIWRSATNFSTIEPYRNYLFKFPNGKYKILAINKISQLEQEVFEDEVHKKIQDFKNQKSKNLLSRLSSINYFELGNKFYRENEYSSAIACYYIHTESNPNTFAVYMNLAHIYLKKDNFDKAIQYYHKAISLQPDKENLSICYSNLGYSYYFKHNFSKSIWCYEKTIALKSNDADIYNDADTYIKLGNSYGKKGENLKQILNYKKAAKLGNQNAQKWLRENSHSW